MGYNAVMRNTQHTAYFARAYAKINLALEVLGKRSDGYHELITIMQTIDLYDTICLTENADGDIHLTCTRPELSNSDNLAVRAAQLVRQRLGVRRGVHIELVKRTPSAAGLGGGSSDAAAVLVGLRRWWQLPLTADAMQEVAASLGSDVPFFLHGGLALCQGRGEQITLLDPYWPAEMRWLLLLKPAISIATAAVFHHITPDDYSDGAHSRAVRAALTAKKMPHPNHLHNGLERTVLQHYPQVAQAKAAMLQAGAPLVRLSGSGPTLFAPFTKLADAQQAYETLRSQGYEVYLSRAVYPEGLHPLGESGRNP